VSIDPNLTHQGIEYTQKHVIAILNYFGLQKNAIICVGYSINKTLSNEGITFFAENGVEYDPYSRFQTEQSCEDTLSNLCAFSHGRFDFAVVDGNHEGSHLRRETALLRRLLRPEGILILDDVSDAWAEIKGSTTTFSQKAGARSRRTVGLAFFSADRHSPAPSLRLSVGASKRGPLRQRRGPTFIHRNDRRDPSRRRDRANRIRIGRRILRLGWTRLPKLTTCPASTRPSTANPSIVSMSGDGYALMRPGSHRIGCHPLQRRIVRLGCEKKSHAIEAKDLFQFG
jgi:hypothetical protein